ncbi:hypothetical protein CAPTEDRAFT_191809 [Capitella teleta]|uniref:Apple domain-containing protein n=1 Tax=Capitella teleta TaxID=283909 RepID=R7TYF1_CAPTE|nr:hypothetical protein CAPTEDRAFT_191809 [Capitella teleta]|eukprot:ELT98764.1 hypothetical protein CAPTEDRAFT_191809 [Capitella teleta]
MEATFRILLLVTFLPRSHSDMLVSKFNPGSIPLHSSVNFEPVAEFESVMHSKIQCAGACVRFQGCVAIVMTDGWCKMYDRTASGSDWIAQSQSVYMELKSGRFVTMPTADRTETSTATERLTLILGNTDSLTSKIPNSMLATQNVESTTRNAHPKTSGLIETSTLKTMKSTGVKIMESTIETTEFATTAQIMESTLETTETATTAQIMESTPETTEASTTAQIMESTPETTETATTAKNMESTPETTESETTAQIMESTPETNEAATTAQIMESTPETNEAATTAQIMESTPETTETATTAQIMESTPETTEASTTAQIMESTPETTEIATTAQIMESTPETTETPTTTKEEENLLNLNCPSTRSCSKLSAEAVFFHYNKSYVVTVGNDYYSFQSVKSMCSGLPYQTGLFSDLTSSPEFTDKPEMLASFMDVLFVFKKPQVTTYGFNAIESKYRLRSGPEDMTTKFPTLLKDGSHCFLAHNFTHGTLFDGDNIYVDSLEFKRDEPFHTTYTNVENPFFNSMPSGNPHGCTETSVGGFIVFLDHEKIYLYDTASKSHTNLGILCKA